MQMKFKIGDYVYAEDWCYGKIVYIDDKCAEVEHGGGSLTFDLEDLRHAEKPTKNNKQKNNSTIDNYERVNICLTCTKPASKCKGDCFGRSN